MRLCMCGVEVCCDFCVICVVADMLIYELDPRHGEYH